MNEYKYKYECLKAFKSSSMEDELSKELCEAPKKRVGRSRTSAYSRSSTAGKNKGISFARIVRAKNAVED